jgi:protein MpaA
VSVHQPFCLVNWDGPAEALARSMSQVTGWPASASVGYPTPGSFGARWGVDEGLAVITLELPRPADEAALARGAAALECARLVVEAPT